MEGHRGRLSEIHPLMWVSALHLVDEAHTGEGMILIVHDGQATPTDQHLDLPVSATEIGTITRRWVLEVVWVLLPRQTLCDPEGILLRHRLRRRHPLFQRVAEETIRGNPTIADQCEIIPENRSVTDQVLLKLHLPELVLLAVLLLDQDLELHQ